VADVRSARSNNPRWGERRLSRPGASVMAPGGPGLVMDSLSGVPTGTLGDRWPFVGGYRYQNRPSVTRNPVE